MTSSNPLTLDRIHSANESHRLRPSINTLQLQGLQPHNGMDISSKIIWPTIAIVAFGVVFRLALHLFSSYMWGGAVVHAITSPDQWASYAHPYTLDSMVPKTYIRWCFYWAAGIVLIIFVYHIFGLVVLEMAQRPPVAHICPECGSNRCYLGHENPCSGGSSRANSQLGPMSHHGSGTGDMGPLSERIYSPIGQPEPLIDMVQIELCSVHGEERQSLSPPNVSDPLCPPDHQMSQFMRPEMSQNLVDRLLFAPFASLLSLGMRVTLAFVVSRLVVDTLKPMFGRWRPDFLGRCYGIIKFNYTNTNQMDTQMAENMGHLSDIRVIDPSSLMGVVNEDIFKDPIWESNLGHLGQEVRILGPFEGENGAVAPKEGNLKGSNPFNNPIDPLNLPQIEDLGHLEAHRGDFEGVESVRRPIGERFRNILYNADIISSPSSSNSIDVSKLVPMPQLTNYPFGDFSGVPSVPQCRFNGLIDMDDARKSFPSGHSAAASSIGMTVALFAFSMFRRILRRSKSQTVVGQVGSVPAIGGLPYLGDAGGAGEKPHISSINPNATPVNNRQRQKRSNVVLFVNELLDKYVTSLSSMLKTQKRKRFALMLASSPGLPILIFVVSGIILPALMASTRVFDRRHHPTDVLAGLVIGWSTALFCHYMTMDSVYEKWW